MRNIRTALTRFFASSIPLPSIKVMLEKKKTTETENVTIKLKAGKQASTEEFYQGIERLGPSPPEYSVIYGTPALSHPYEGEKERNLTRTAIAFAGLLKWISPNHWYHFVIIGPKRMASRLKYIRIRMTI